MENLIKHWHQHGVDVNMWYHRLIKDPQIIGNDKIICWFENYIPLDGIEIYHINHDISKPYIVQYDEHGRAHYPTHWISSYEMFKAKFGDSVYADLILHDSDFHMLKGDQLASIWKLPYAEHLYATAWAAIFANAELFGGMDSDSFKIKRKHLIRAFNKR